jgi:hypothetical protein
LVAALTELTSTFGSKADASRGLAEMSACETERTSVTTA